MFWGWSVFKRFQSSKKLGYWSPQVVFASWIELIGLRKSIKTNNLKHIHEIWPKLQVYILEGVAFGPYKKVFNAY